MGFLPPFFCATTSICDVNKVLAALGGPGRPGTCPSAAIRGMECTRTIGFKYAILDNVRCILTRARTYALVRRLFQHSTPREGWGLAQLGPRRRDVCSGCGKRASLRGMNNCVTHLCRLKYYCKLAASRGTQWSHPGLRARTDPFYDLYFPVFQYRPVKRPLRTH